MKGKILNYTIRHPNIPSLKFEYNNVAVPQKPLCILRVQPFKRFIGICDFIQLIVYLLCYHPKVKLHHCLKLATLSVTVKLYKKSLLAFFAIFQLLFRLSLQLCCFSCFLSIRLAQHAALLCEVNGTDLLRVNEGGKIIHLLFQSWIMKIASHAASVNRPLLCSA